MFWIQVKSVSMRKMNKSFYYFWVKIVKKKKQLIFCLEMNPQMNDEYRSRKFGICLKANTQTTVCLRLIRTRQAKMERRFERIKQTSIVFVSISWKLRKKTRTANYIHICTMRTAHVRCSIYNYLLIEVVSSKYVNSKFKQQATIKNVSNLFLGTFSRSNSMRKN